MTSLDKRIAGEEGDAALPRKNGELVFAAPWEGRAFGMAVALYEKGAYEWDEFRGLLVEEIAAGHEPYYASWLRAFERVVIASGLVSSQQIEHRVEEYKSLERDPVF